MRKVDYIIIGQGLAGTVLSYHLLEKNKKVLVINKNIPNSSSKIAAGIFNPVTGRRLVQTWNSETLFPYLLEFYSKLETTLKAKFLNALEIYRPFTSIEDQNESIGRTATVIDKRFINKIYTSTQYDNILNDPYGGISFNYSGYVNLPVLLSAYRDFLLEIDAYQEFFFQEEQLILRENFVIYNNIIADKVIYCDGENSRFGKYFQWLPYNPVKGELLLVQLKYDIPQIISRGIYLVPQGQGCYKAGATYNWNDSSKIISAEGKQELNNKLKSLLKIPFYILEDYAGIRPATKDRRPFIGIHPEYKTIAIFNGLGSKGVSIAPYFARQFADFLVTGKELETDVNISRYKSLYYN